ncbi:methylated-DNA--protein-cysteine methyltransferase isoform X2 [Cherax quadricarinatus]|uniref:methylated-DNA--protein-cysteine methyltransferase isoform X2 n=1 Tax=Cherax quadricarinatus TaxID=27406 RepID=UPI002379ECE3|nr:methylated-DNA--protein-cysteine methyltransferase-like isoform X2 [Cherax quadricarinatus]
MSAKCINKEKQGSCGLPGTEYCFSSPLGYINITACAAGLHSLQLDGSINDENFSPNERTEVQLLTDDLKTQSQVIKQCHKWLQTYFKNPKLLTKESRPDICCFKLANLGFLGQVWKTLADTVGPGEVITYGALAARINNPGAVRAVGSAMRKNQNGIIVPCHRVVRSNGMGLYHRGSRQKIKLWLLKHEVMWCAALETCSTSRPQPLW